MVEFSIKKVLSRLSRRRGGPEGIQRVLDLFAQGAYVEAHGALLEVMAEEARLSQAEIAFAYALLADLELLTNGDVREAQKSLDRARELGFPEADYYWRIQGDIRFRAGSPHAAIACYEKSVALDPAVGNRVMLAQALSAVQDERAMDVWTRIVEDDPKNCLAHVGLAWLAARSGDRDRALLMAKRAEQLSPSAKDVFEIGCIYHMAEEFAAAVRAYLRADELGSENKARLYAGVAACYKKLGETDQARLFAESAFRCDPHDEYVRAIWQEIQGETGDSQCATKA